jgi:hypothetical protein
MVLVATLLLNSPSLKYPKKTTCNWVWWSVLLKEREAVSTKL